MGQKFSVIGTFFQFFRFVHAAEISATARHANTRNCGVFFILSSSKNQSESILRLILFSGYRRILPIIATFLISLVHTDRSMSVRALE